MKNIPISSNQQYKTGLTSAGEIFLKNFNWYVNAHIHKLPPTTKNTFGFPTPNMPPPVPELKAFQDDFLNMIKNVEFRHVSNNFQTSLKNTAKEIKNSNEVIIAADKTRNLYTMPTKDYKQTRSQVITSEYKKTNYKEVNNTNKNAAKITQELGIADRVDEYTEPPPFLTIKDHKDSFPDTKSYRLINPAKSNLGKVSKNFLQKIVKKIRKTTNSKLWTNTTEVLQWFKSIENKDKATFIKFDICNYYPSITKKLFEKAVNWAKNYHNFSEVELKTINQTKESYLFLDGQPWRKKTTENFDVAQGSYDGAETCELVGLLILDEIKAILPNAGLYRDDGLGVFKGTKVQLERTKKRLFKLFESLGLKIEITAGMTETDFLDTRMNLTTNTYRPHMKENNSPVYINSKSNHPPAIKRQIPDMIAKRISTLSSNQLIFEREKIPYQQALEAAGYTTKLDYSPPPTAPADKKKTRCRKVVYFNPPFCESVKTNIGKKFIALITKHFANTPLSKIINRNTVKISYRTMPNIGSIISSHNKKLLDSKPEQAQTAQKTCNCKIKSSCPQNRNCLKRSVIYKAEISDNNNKATYIGLTAGTFKTRYNLHKSDFNLRHHASKTTLATYVWEQRDKGNEEIRKKINWSYIASAPAYNPSTGKCQLCTREKMEILYSNDPHLLNKRTEINAKCRHRERHTLSSYINNGKKKAKPPPRHF